MTLTDCAATDSLPTQNQPGTPNLPRTSFPTSASVGPAILTGEDNIGRAFVVRTGAAKIDRHRGKAGPLPAWWYMPRGRHVAPHILLCDGPESPPDGSLVFPCRLPSLEAARAGSTPPMRP